MQLLEQEQDALMRTWACVFLGHVALRRACLLIRVINNSKNKC